MVTFSQSLSKVMVDCVHARIAQEHRRETILRAPGRDRRERERFLAELEADLAWAESLQSRPQVVLPHADSPPVEKPEMNRRRR
jgi:hypothetical protein